MLERWKSRWSISRAKLLAKLFNRGLYPLVLLPCSKRKLITKSLNGYYLIRHANVLSLESVLDVTGDISQKHICDPTEQVHDLSTSLLGVFTEDHIFLQPIDSNVKYFIEYCEPDAIVVCPRYKKDFHEIRNRQAIIFPIQLFDGKEVVFKKDEKDVRATCRVCHTPTRCNYWHFSLRWEFEGNLSHLLPTTKWRKRLGSSARAFAAKYGTIELPTYSMLEEVDYKKSVA